MPHPYELYCLVPSLVAVVLAILTRRVVLSMFLAIFVGALITRSGNVVLAVSDTFEVHLWKTFSDEDKLRIYSFTLLMGAMIGVIHRSGGMTGLVNVVARWANNRRRGQLATWVLGLLVFFDDYANTVLLGKTLQPLTDRLKISREKLAFLVDSTAAPVAGLALISTWVAGEIDYIQQGLDSASVAADITAFELFVASIPYRFYVLFALFFVMLIGLLRRDFGPMYKAELKTVSASEEKDEKENNDSQEKVSGWWNAIIPVCVTVFSVVWLMILTGQQNLNLVDVSIAHLSFEQLRDVVGNSDTYYSLLWGTAIGLATSVFLVFAQRLLTWQETGDAIGHGAKLMLPAIAVLWMASALSALTANKDLNGNQDYDENGKPKYSLEYRLYTGEYLAGLIATDPKDDETKWLQISLPTVIFILAAGISFATGTSWGTMAIVMPIAITLVVPLITQDANWSSSPLLHCTVGSVLAGSIFGDHCSPISDTTVLSSQSCGCDHTAHVWTQLPYALLVGLVSILLGTLPIGLGIPVWVLLPVGAAILVGFLLFFGKTIPVSTEQYE